MSTFGLPLNMQNEGIMKITITLTAAEVAGIKAYLCDTSGIEQPNKADVTEFIEGVVNTINAPGESVSDYIQAAQAHINN